MKATFLSIITFLLVFNAIGQTQAITQKGDTIIIFDNGTWKNKVVDKKKILKDILVKTNTKVDEFTNAKSIKTDMWQDFGVSSTKYRLSGSVSLYNEGVYGVLLFLAHDLGCMFQQDSTLKVKLSNGQIVDFIQVSKTDCGSVISSSFIPVSKTDLQNPSVKGLIKENVEILKEFDWVSMRITGTDYSVDIKPRASKKQPNPEQFFRQHLTAIDNEL